jgi:hypothetical protein
MKSKLFSGAILALLVTAGIPANAQSYSINWYKIAGGGGASTSTNGQYSVSGTIGQQDASSALTGGNYSLTGGFWGVIALVQTLNAPPLSISYSGNQIIISWPSSSTGWVAQSTPALVSSPWENYGGTVVSNTLTITNPPKNGNLFFRLYHP